MGDATIGTTPGSGENIVTVEITSLNGVSVSTRDIQAVLMMARTGTNSASDVSATNPLWTQIVGTPTVAVVDSTPIQVKPGATNVLRPVITGSTSPGYAIGDIVGGEITITNAARNTGWGLKLNRVNLFSDDNFTPVLDLMFFDTDLIGGTYTDNGPLTLSTADKGAWITTVPIASANWKTLAGDSWMSLGVEPIPLKPNGTQDLRMIIITQTAFTLSSTSALRINLGVTQD
jgi:hypothetical protein